MSESKKRRQISLETKLEIIQLYNNNNNTRPVDLAKKFDFPLSTVLRIIKEKNQEELLKYVKNNAINSNSKRLKTSTYDKLNKAIDQWFAENNSTPINGPLLQEEARRLATIFNIPEFKASDEWLDDFKKRNNKSVNGVPHGLTKPIVNVEASSVDKYPGSLTDEETAEEEQDSNMFESADSGSNAECSIIEAQAPPISARVALVSIDMLKKYFFSQHQDCTDGIFYLYKLESFVKSQMA